MTRRGKLCSREAGSCSSCAAGTRRSALPRWRRMRPSPPRQSEPRLDDLLAAGRTSSLQRWVAAARSAGAEGGLIDYAESEALLRADELDAAIALAYAGCSVPRRRPGRARTPRRRQIGTSDGPLRAGRRARRVRRGARQHSEDSRGSALAALSRGICDRSSRSARSTRSIQIRRTTGHSTVAQ